MVFSRLLLIFLTLTLRLGRLGLRELRSWSLCLLLFLDFDLDLEALSIFFEGLGVNANVKECEVLLR